VFEILVSNIIAVVCFAITLFGYSSKKIKKSKSIIVFVMAIFALGSITTWVELFVFSNRHGLL
jgi:hypothetical protein